MNDQDKTKQQLLNELHAVRAQLAVKEQAELANARIVETLRSATRLQAFLDNSSAVSYVKDEEGLYLYVSDNLHRCFGRTAALQIGKTDWDLWPPAMARQLRENDTRVLQSGEPLELVETVPALNGELRHFLTFKFPFRDAAGNLYVGGLSVDITHRKRTEDKQIQYADRLRALSRRLVEMQEEERHRLARELHDEIGQALTSLRFTLELETSSDMEVAKARLDEARALIEETMMRVRGLSFDLRPALLDHLGLLAALNSLLERYTTRTKVQVSFKHAGLAGRLPPEIETTGFRIVQEALTNIARHSGVGEAAVRVWVEADALEIQIEDQGAGFDLEAVLASGRSSGLPGMIERVQLLGGQLTIDAAPAGGTHIQARLPLIARKGEKSMSISIVLADDHPVVRQGLHRLLDAEPDFTIAGEAADGLETVRLVERLHPNVLLLDLMMPGLNGLDVLPIVRQRVPRTRVLVFSMYSSEEFVLLALRNGAAGYILKGCDPSHIIEAVRTAAAGRYYLSPQLSELAIKAFQEKAEATAPDPHDLLTPRERQVLQLAAEGHSGPEIAARLSISPRTVEMHRANSMRKLHLKTPADLIRYALRRGMIPMQE